MSPARPSTCTLRVSRHTCSMVLVHTSSHGAASRTTTGENTNTHAALLPPCTVAAEETVRCHHSSSVALEGGVDNSERCVRLCRCHVLWSSIHVVYHTVSFTTHAGCLHNSVVWRRRLFVLDSLGPPSATHMFCFACKRRVARLQRPMRDVLGNGSGRAPPPSPPLTM